MPTGYTADIAEGMTFHQFAWGCARAFGALVLMRDDPSDAPIPESFEPSNFYSLAVDQAKIELHRLCKMTADEAEAEANREHMMACLRHESAIVESAVLRTKYEAMLVQVRAWNAPTPDHAAYKSFMESQLTESIDFDCRTDYLTAPDRPHTDEWLNRRIANERENIARYETEHAKEVERTASRNLWIRQLRDSLEKVEA